MENVMERRNLLAGLMVLVISLFMVTGTASARVIHKKNAKPSVGKPASENEVPTPETCVVHSLGSFMDQGEFGTSSSVADIVEVECEEVYSEHFVKLSATELYNRCDKELSWSEPAPYAPVTGPNYTVKLDNDGNAIAALWGGPSCAAGESLISAHLETAPYSTVVTGFTVLPPRVTEPGVFVTPAEQVETEENSSVATIVQVEFPPVFAEKDVNVNASQLYARCQLEPKLKWIGPDEDEIASETEEILELKLDNDGNAFVVLLGGESCAAGQSMIEASLEEAPYTTYTGVFTIKAPEPTFP